MHSRHEALLEEFVLCLDEKRYYDAHEALEELWFTRRFEQDNEVKLLKGFINASVCFELHARGRENPAKKAWLNYLKYRPLLYKTESKFSNKYNAMSRYIDAIYYKKTSHNSPISHKHLL
jgi:hypothetical protein